MKVYSWNVNGIRAAFKKGLREWIDKEQPDILGIQEIKTDLSQVPTELLKIPGYFSFFNPADKKGYSGTALYSKKEPRIIKYGIGIKKFDIEGRIIIGEFKDLTFLNIYFPNGQKNQERLNYKLEFYEAVLEYCNKERSKGKKLLISGDYNTAHNEIDLKNPKANSERSGFLRIEREWIDKFISENYYDTFRYLYPNRILYSWWSYRFNARSKNIGWRIDYHFVSDNLIESVIEADILTNVSGSDHCPIMVEIDID